MARLGISLKLEGVLGQADQAVKHPLTDVLTMLAYGHYYRTVSLFYSEWETSYLDAPVCNDAQLVSVSRGQRKRFDIYARSNAF